MFIIGLFLMTISVAGLVGLAFMQARYPEALDSMLLPPEARKAKAEAEIMQAMPPSQAEEETEAEIDLGNFTINSMPQTMQAPQAMATPQSE